jgi:hypothetical protein
MADTNLATRAKKPAVRSIQNFAIDPAKGGISQIILGPPETADAPVVAAPATEEPLDEFSIGSQRYLEGLIGRGLQIPSEPFEFEWSDTPIDPAIANSPEVNRKYHNRQATDARNVLAGFYDLGPSIPLILGLASSGVNTLGREAMELLGLVDEPRSIGENFRKQMEDGFNRTLIQAGLGGFEAVNEFVDVAPPRSTANTLLRSAGQSAPIPGFAVAQGGSKLANLGKGFINFATPAIKTGGRGIDELALRSGLQLLAGASIDQGLTSLTGTESLSDDVYDAITGLDFDLTSSAEAAEAADTEFEWSDSPIQTDTGADTEFEWTDKPSIIDPEDFVLVPRSTEPDELPELSHGVRVSRSLDAAIEAEQDRRDRITLYGTMAALGGVYFGKKVVDHQLKKAGLFPETGIEKFIAGIDVTRFGSVVPKHPLQYSRELQSTLREGYTNAEDFISARWFDTGLHMKHALRNAGFGPNAINSVMENFHIDPRGIADTLHTVGRWGQGFIPRWKNVRPLREMATDYHALDNRTKKVLNDAIKAEAEKVKVTQEAAKDGRLFPTAYVAKLDATIKLARDRPETGKLLKEFGQFLDNHLEYMVKRGRLSIDDAKAFRMKFGVSSNTSSFMPMYSENQREFLDSLAKFFGVHTKRGAEIKEANELLTLRLRGTDEVDGALMNPIDAMEIYSRSVIEHVSTNSYWKQSLAALSGVHLQGSTVTRLAHAIDNKGRVIESPNTVGVTYLGQGTVNEVGIVDNVSISAKSRSQFSNGSLADVEKQAPGEIFTVYDNGVPHVFHVPDKGVQKALDTNPHLGGPLTFLNHYKTIMTDFTVGRYSPFAIKSNIYAMEQAMQAIAGREGLIQALEVIPRNIQGTGLLALQSASRELSMYLAQRLAANNGFLKHTPGVEALQRLLEKAHKNTISSVISAQTGRTATGPGHRTFDPTLVNASSHYGQEFNSWFPGVNEAMLMGRLWKGFVSAFQEGPAYGLELRLVDRALRNGEKLTPRKYRQIADEAKKLTGDMKKIGSGPEAALVNAALPFSTATLQSFSALGSAFKANPGRFVAGTIAFVGVPTAAELALNQMISIEAELKGQRFEAPGGELNHDGTPKTYSYMEWYWNVFTPLDRISNRIVFRPGMHPNEAHFFPISPEWSVARGLFLDGLTELYGYNRVGFTKEMAERGDLEWMNLHTGLARSAGIPNSPIIAAFLSQAGIRTEAGLHPEVSTDPENPGRELTFFETMPLPSPDRLTDLTSSRSPGGDLSVSMSASIQDIGGAIGNTYVAFHEAFNAGLEFDPEHLGFGGSLGKAMEMGLDAAGESTKRQLKTFNPLFGGGVAHPNANTHPVTEELRGKVRTLQRLKKTAKLMMSGGTMSGAGTEFEGNTTAPNDDPIWRTVAQFAETMLGGLNIFSSLIQERRENIASIRNATNFPSIQARNDRIDSITQEILAYRHQQLIMAYQFEDKMTELVSSRLGRDVVINLTTLAPREASSLPERSADQEFRMSPPISQ